MMHLPTSEYLKQQNRHLCVRQNFPHPGQPLSLAWLLNMPRVSFQGHRCNLQFVLIPITFDYLLNPNQNTDVYIVDIEEYYPCPVLVRLDGVSRSIKVVQLGTRHKLPTTNKYMCAGGTHCTPRQWSLIRGMVKQIVR